MGSVAFVDFIRVLLVGEHYAIFTDFGICVTVCGVLLLYLVDILLYVVYFSIRCIFSLYVVYFTICCRLSLHVVCFHYMLSTYYILPTHYMLSTLLYNVYLIIYCLLHYLISIIKIYCHFHFSQSL